MALVDVFSVTEWNHSFSARRQGREVLDSCTFLLPPTVEAVAKVSSVATLHFLHSCE